MENTKWVSTWANATSIITRQVENYTKDITLRYPIKSAFKGSKLRFGFSNFCGTESITITSATVAKSDEKGNLISDTTAITFKGKESVTIEKGIESREYLYNELSKIDSLNVFPSKSNFMLIGIKDTGFTASEFAFELMKKGVIVRDCTSFKGLDEYWIRISICTLEEDKKFIDIVKEVLS